MQTEMCSVKLIRSLLLLIFLFTVRTHLFAQGSLLIAPRRVVFEAGRKVQEVNVANNGRDTMRYIVQLQDMQMLNDGQFRIIPGDSAKVQSTSIIKFYPKHLVLAPGEAQIVKLQLINRSGGKLPEGEYRCHLVIRPVATQAIPKIRKMVTHIKLRLKPAFSFTIPVIVRLGASDTRVAISDISFPLDTVPRLLFALKRTGNMSAYGDIHVFFEQSGRSTSVGSLLGLSVYYPNVEREFTIALARKGVNYRNGKFHIIYT
ncbi:MAG: hypothetical protein EOP49_03665, partial [Sphingobacteriales bacterium]